MRGLAEKDIVEREKALDEGRRLRLRFVSAEERGDAVAALAGGGRLVAVVDPVDPSQRGSLGEAIDEAIERELQGRGAPGPGLIGATSFDSYRDATLGDQLFRARRAGASGIAVVLGSLRSGNSAIAPEDTATLSFLAEATRERALVLLLDEGDRKTPAYATTAPLDEVLCPRIPPTLVPPSPRSGSVSASASGSESASASASASESAPESGPASPPVVARDSWRPYVLQLSAARGPQSLAALEKLFVDSYVPLAGLLAAGLDEPRAREAHDQFAASFSKSYAEAFATFAVTGKRPRMVFDAHDVAARIGRLHGARTVKLLLVDAMRWDVAQRIQERLATTDSGATLTDELLLWSALPTTTWRQLETIARGMEAFRAPASLESDTEPPRGRNAEYIRRMRVGPREIYKLDVVESRVQGARAGVLRELPGIADEAADAIARHVQSLAPRTLLFVFGDHGFAVDKKGMASQGGASPEEVLVGAFALLVGDVH
jgi:hypothetical protein